jgi:hypothetical protein
VAKISEVATRIPEGAQESRHVFAVLEDCGECFLCMPSEVRIDASKRSQIMDRDHILDLYTVTGLPLPEDALQNVEPADEIPF